MTADDLRAELEKHHVAAFGWALSCCAWDRTEAEDALQASYLKVLDGRARFDGHASFRTWLFGVIRHTAAEHRRRAGRRQRKLAAWKQEPAETSENPEAALSQSEANRILLSALQTLAPRQQEILHLVFYQGLTIQEASRVAGVSIGTARTHYERGKAKLRQLLAVELEV